MSSRSNADPDQQMRRLLVGYDEEDRGCWVWRGVKTVGGYGIMRVGGGRREYVHRISHRLFKGPIPDGFEIDHLCRTRACVNPDHLEAVPPRVNFGRGEHPHARAHRNGVCAKGLHEMTPANAMPNGAGQRRCRACSYQWQRQRRALRAPA